jgi:hypothetical protein
MNHFKNSMKLQWALLTIVILSVAQLLVLPVEAAKSWEGTAEEIPRFETKVMDINCELTGHCSSNCSDAKRELELPTPDKKLALTSKRSSANRGAAHDPANSCKKQFIADEFYREHRGVRFLVAQTIHEAPYSKWRGANRYLKKRSAGPGIDESKADSWFRHNPDVKHSTESDHLLGLGKKQDQVYFNTK